MNSTPENFEDLQRLLALKRYEQPPPRFFANFSNTVIARIEAQEQQDALPWWERLGLTFSLKPAFMCGFGVVTCGLLSLGILASSVGNRLPMVAAQEPGFNAQPASPLFHVAQRNSGQPAAQPQVARSSMAPVLVSPSVFDQFRPAATQVGFTVESFQ